MPVYFTQEFPVCQGYGLKIKSRFPKQPVQKGNICLVIQLAVPFHIGPFSAHAHTGSELQNEYFSGFFVDPLRIGCQVRVLAAVGTGAKLQTMGVSQLQGRETLDDRQKEGLSLIRTMLGNTSSSVAIPQLVSMMDKTDTNAALLLKMKDWFALMNR